MGKDMKTDNGIKWTDQQAHVIDTRHGNLLVSAAAGSGKTAVLVERIIEMVAGRNSRGDRIEGSEPVSVDELLVVTFTNAAAAQMKEKIGQALQKKIDEMMAKGEYDEHLIKQMTLINHADICTIDSFCLRIVKEYFARVELDCAFGIADDTEMKIIKHDVMDQVMEMCYEDESVVPGFDRLIMTFARNESDSAVPDIVERIIKVISSYPEPKKWLAQAADAMKFAVDTSSTEEEKRREVMGIPMVRTFADRVYMMLRTADDMVRECQKYATEAYGLEAYGLRVDKDVELITHMLRSCGGEDDLHVDLFELRDIYRSSLRPEGLKMEKDAQGRSICYAFDRFVNPGGGADPEKKEFVKSRRDVYKSIIDDIVSVVLDVDDILRQAAMTEPVISSLLKLTELYMDELMKVKMDKNMFEFHDIEEFAFRILCDGIEDDRAVPSEIGKEVSRRYREILIDEYQDSNFLQEYILASVSGHGEDIHNTFMVGDVKQSIYRFRMARPDLFIEKYDSYRRLGDADIADPDIDGNSILLTRNFRSEINVLKTVNSIFAQLMRREIGDIEYDEGAKLNSRFAISDGEGMKEPDDVDHGPVSEFILIDNNMREADVSEEYGNPEVEANYIAGKIRDIVDGSEPLYVGSGADRRPVRYKDIVILLRSVSTASTIFDRVFQEKGIPLYIESESGYFDAAEIRTLVSMLSIVDNSYVDYDLAAVLRSPLVGLDEEELAVIVGEYRSRYEKNGTDWNARLYDKVIDYMDTHVGEKKHAVDRLWEFLRMLDYLKKNKNYMSISDIIRYVLDTTGFYWFVGARPMGRRRQANIDMLIKKADDFEENSKGVFNFIRYVDELKTNDLDFAEADVVSENEDVVRVMTMHKSKGLEFPVVFVSGLGKEFNLMDTRSNVLVHQDHYLACDQVDLRTRARRMTFFKRIMSKNIVAETYAEEMRVLYVALTRAKEKLYMTGCVKDADKFKAACDMYIIGDRMNYASIMKANGYAAWIYTALRYVGECDHVKSIEVEADSFMSPETDQDEAENMTVEASEVKLDKELYDHVKNGLEFRYGYRHSGLKSKMSITEIKRLQAHGEDAITPDILTSREYSARSEVPIPAFMSEERIVHGNEIGNIYHKIMELADFSGKTVADAEKDVDRVFELGLFDELYRERIRPKKIYKMIHSEIGQRMAAAGKSDRLYRERQFYMMMEPGEIMSSLKDCGDETIVVQGIIDAYFEEDGGIVLLDYKTDSVKDASELVKRYHVQLDKYADVLEQLTGMKVKEKVIYSFCLDTTVNL